MARQKFTLVGLGFMMVPVKKKGISRTISLPMKEIHNIDGCGATMGREKVCKGCGVTVPPEEVGKGWARTSKDPNPVPFTVEELAGLKPTDVPEETMQIVNFIDPPHFRYYDGSHAVINVDGTNPTAEAYLSLLLNGLKATKKVAHIRYFDNGKVYNSVLDSDGVLSGIYHSDEVQSVDDTRNYTVTKAAKKPLEMVTKLIKANILPFDPETDLVNTYREAVTKTAMLKVETGQFTPMIAPVVDMPQVDPAADMMAVMSAQLDAMGKKKKKKTA